VKQSRTAKSKPLTSLEISNKFFIVQPSVRKLIFNDKECCILILKNLTSALQFKKANEQKESMLNLTTTVSHEMRLPLESSITMCKLMLSWATDDRFIELLKSIWSANKIILCRVNDLLDLSTLDKGVFTPKLKVFDWRKSVEEVVKINSPQALFKDNKFNYFSSSTMPNYIRTDDTRMQ